MCPAVAVAACFFFFLRVILGACLGVESLWYKVFSPFSDSTLPRQSGGDRICPNCSPDSVLSMCPLSPAVYFSRL